MKTLALPMVALLLGLVPPSASVPVDVAAREKLLRLGPMPPVPLDPTNRWSGNEAAAELGQRLFYDANLSRNGSVSCATCHTLQSGFADSRRLARGIGDGTRHTQSLLNAAYQRWLTWDGRSDSLWSQALHPFQNDKEMGLTPREVVQRVRDTSALRRRYEAVFGRLPALDDAAGVQAAFVKLGKAIGAFERRIVSGQSPFDRWLDRVRAGDSAPTKEFGADAVRGALLFVGKADCVRCHSGPLLSDGEFHMIGVPEGRGGAPVDRGRLEGIELLQADPCNAAGVFSDDPTGPRAKVTLATVPDPEAWGRFRTPSLRAASLTPPFMHQGQLDTLAEVVHFYNTLEGASSLDHHSERVLEPLGLSLQQEADLVSFLRAVTGSTPGGVEVARPRPESSDLIPKSSEISPVGTSQPGIPGP